MLDEVTIRHRPITRRRANQPEWHPGKEFDCPKCMKSKSAKFAGRVAHSYGNDGVGRGAPSTPILRKKKWGMTAKEEGLKRRIAKLTGGHPHIPK